MLKKSKFSRRLNNPTRITYPLLAILLALVAISLLLLSWGSAAARAEASAAGVEASTTITVDTTFDGIDDNGDCTLREAVQAANSDTAVDACPAGDGWDTIILPAGTYVLTETGALEDANLTGDLDILDSLTIVGQGAEATVIDGNAADRVLHLDPDEDGLTLHLKGVQVTNGQSDNGGGLYQSNGLSIIEESLVTRNQVTGTLADNGGGGIYAELGVVRVLSSTISYNRADNSVAGDSDGGGIYLDTAVLHLQDSVVLSNSVPDGEGGGIYADYASITLQAARVMSNTAEGGSSGGPGGGWGGGGVNIHNSNLVIEEHSEISFNSSMREGGGIYADSYSRLTIFDGWIHHNESAKEGGGVFADGYGTYMRRTTLEHNTSDGEGGGIYADGDLILIDSRVQYNHSDDTDDGGGGIYEYGEYSALVISNTLVHSNTTAGYGGGVYMYEYGGFTVFNSIFSENQAVKDGGGVYMDDEASIYVEESAFLNNLAANGGAIYTYSEVGLTVERATFSGNRATADGGALYLSGDDYGPTDIRNSTLSDNNAGDRGGAIYSYYPGVAIEFSTIVSNSAGTSGGGVFENEYSVWIQNSILASNRAAGSAAHPNADCDIANLFSGGFNIFGDGAGCAATRFDQSLTPGTIFASVLAPLADNGGAALPDGSHPETHALLGGSPAIDAAGEAFCPAVDERGVTRPQGNACDVGAYESNSSAVVAAPTLNIITVNTTDDELNGDGDCSLREAVQAANSDKAVDNCPAGEGWDTISLPKTQT